MSPKWSVSHSWLTSLSLFITVMVFICLAPIQVWILEVFFFSIRLEFIKILTNALTVHLTRKQYWICNLQRHARSTLQWRNNERDGASNHQNIYSTIYSGTDQRKHQSFASLAAAVRGIHRWPVNSTHRGPVTRKMFPFDDVIMK